MCIIVVTLTRVSEGSEVHFQVKGVFSLISPCLSNICPLICITQIILFVTCCFIWKKTLDLKVRSKGLESTLSTNKQRAH